MKKSLSVFLLGLTLISSLIGCQGKDTTQIEIEPDSIVSISISGYPTIFANGDSIDTTTDITRITEITTAFQKVTLEYYKTKEEWENIDATAKRQDIIAFFNTEKQCVERFIRVTNAEGNFIAKYVEDKVYTVTEKDYPKLSSIFYTLLNEAKEGRLND